jgi:hypothetical protein
VGVESVVLRKAAVDQDDLRATANQLPNVLDVRLPTDRRVSLDLFS